jgi:hypothetical protein
MCGVGDAIRAFSVSLTLSLQSAASQSSWMAAFGTAAQDAIKNRNRTLGFGGTR